MTDLIALVVVIAVTVAGAEMVRALCRRQLLEPARIETRTLDPVAGAVREHA